jgi:hypothetical protein
MKSPEQELVFTLTFEDSGGGTLYTARVRYWPVEEAQANEKTRVEIR